MGSKYRNLCPDRCSVVILWHNTLKHYEALKKIMCAFSFTKTWTLNWPNWISPVMRRTPAPDVISLSICMFTAHNTQFISCASHWLFLKKSPTLLLVCLSPLLVERSPKGCYLAISQCALFNCPPQSEHRASVWLILFGCTFLLWPGTPSSLPQPLSFTHCCVISIYSILLFCILHVCDIRKYFSYIWLISCVSCRLTHVVSYGKIL